MMMISTTYFIMLYIYIYTLQVIFKQSKMILDCFT